MDNQAFIAQMLVYVTTEQAAAILDDLTNPDPYLGYCVVCGKKHIPLDANGNEWYEDVDQENPQDPAGYAEPHEEDCPVALLKQELQPQPAQA